MSVCLFISLSNMSILCLFVYQYFYLLSKLVYLLCLYVCYLSIRCQICLNRFCSYIYIYLCLGLGGYTALHSGSAGCLSSLRSLRLPANRLTSVTSAQLAKIPDLVDLNLQVSLIDILINTIVE